MSKKAIVIIGKDRCGKDYIGKKLADEYNGEIVRFADTLKDICCYVSGLSREELDRYKNNEASLRIVIDDHGRKRERLGDVRDFLINTSKAIKKAFGETVFTRDVVERIRATDKIIIATDVRFTAELEALRNNVDKMFVINITSDLSTCGKNGLVYQLPDLWFNTTFHNNLDLDVFEASFKKLIYNIDKFMEE